MLTLPYSTYARTLDLQSIEMVGRLRPKPVRLSDHAPLTDDEYEASVRRIAEYRRLLETREAQIPAAQKALLMPAMNWRGHDHRDYGYMHAILAGDRKRLNHLRFYTRFTGFSLYYMDYHRDRETPLDLPANLDQIVDSRLLVPDLWVQRYLLMMATFPSFFIVPPPRRFAEIGWDVSGVTVNHDTVVYQERVRLLYQSGILLWLYKKLLGGRRPLIVEIGTGFGGLAYRLCSLFPEANYLCLDLPESLLFPNLYLGLSLPKREHRLVTGDAPLPPDIPDATTAGGDPTSVTYVPNYLAFEALRNVRADLVINTLSFAEMSEEQVASYGRLASTMLGNDGLLFDQNQDNRPAGMIDAKPVLAACFPHRMDMPVIDPFGLTEGLASLWGNRPVTDILKA